jgi:hypothetical protein
VNSWGSTAPSASGAASTTTSSSAAAPSGASTTFTGKYTCQLTGAVPYPNCVGGDMIPENNNPTGENWHYLFGESGG